MSPKIQAILDAVRDYQRPARCVVWVLCIAFAFIGFVTGICKEQINNTETMAIILGMFADMGVYGLTKSFEKQAEIKANANSTTNTNVTLIKTPPDEPETDKDATPAPEA